MELKRFDKAKEIVVKIRNYESRLETIRKIINTDNYSDFVIERTEQEGLRCYETMLPLTEEYTRGIILSLNSTYRRIVEDLYKELEAI